MSAKVVTITSGKGGVGKTTATANLGVALAELGKNVVCIDADIGLRNLDVIMGLENRIVYDLVDVVEGRCKLRQAMIRDKRLENLYLIPAAQTRDKSSVSPQDMIKLANEKTQEIKDADRILGLVEAEEKGPAMLVVNRVKADMVRRGDMLGTDDILDVLAIKLIGIVPEDESVIVASNHGTPVALDTRSQAGKAFRNIARRMMGEDVPFDELSDKDGFFGRLTRLMKTGGE